MRRMTVLAATTLAAALVAMTGCAADNGGDVATQQDDGPEFAVPAYLEGRGSITYCATLDNPPRASVDESSDQVGFEVDLGEEIARLGGLDVTWLQLTFDGLISAVQADQCDAIVQELFIREERLEIIDMVPFSNTGQRIVVRDGEFSDAQSLEDFSGVKLAVPNGTSIQTLALEANEALEAEGKDPIDLIVLTTTTDTFQQLDSGVVDAVGTTTTAAAYYSDLNPDFVQVGEPFGLIETGIGIKKGNDELTEFIQAAFDHIRESGQYDALIAKWNMQGSEL